MEQKVIEKSQYVEILNKAGAKKLYPYQELMNNFGVPGTNWKYNGGRTIVFTEVIAGKDSPIDKQMLVKGGAQNWSMKDATKVISREREFYANSDEIYEETANVDGLKIMQAYDKQGRPQCVTRGISEDLFAEAQAYSNSEDESVSAVIESTANVTPAQAWAYFDEMKALMEDNTEYDSDLIFYCVPSFYRALVNGDVNKRVIMNGSDAIKRSLAEIDGVKIRTVNPKNMKSKYDGNVKDAGLTPAADAKQVLAFMVAVDAVAVPFIIDSVYIDAPHAGSKGKWEVVNRYAFNAIANPFYGLGVAALVQGDAVPAEVNP